MGSYCMLDILNLLTTLKYSSVSPLIISNYEYHTSDTHLISNYESYWIDICKVGECNAFSL